MPNRHLHNTRSQKIASRGRRRPDGDRDRGDREPKSPLSRAGYRGGAGRRERTRARTEAYKSSTDSSRRCDSVDINFFQIERFLRK